jgi:gamma-glutamylcyclotransferase (GGCT)/AIG2-like uncharacterized protein YtfP
VLLFCYGTLQFPEVMQALTGLRIDGRPAVLPDYACYVLRGEVFPGIVARHGASTAGVIYRGIGRRQLRLLDRFEGDCYHRIEVRASEAGGSRRRAWAYVVAPYKLRLVSNETWHSEVFAEEHLASFVSRALWARAVVRDRRPLFLKQG